MKNKMLIPIALIVFLAGCTSVIENMPGYAHTAALILGAPKQTVILNAEHVLGKPKEVLNDESNEVHIRRYKFDDDQDIALYFNKISFVQLVLVDLNDELSFRITSDQYVKLGGFVLSKTKNGHGKLSFIRRKGQSAVPPIKQGSF